MLNNEIIALKHRKTCSKGASKKPNFNENVGNLAHDKMNVTLMTKFLIAFI